MTPETPKAESSKARTATSNPTSMHLRSLDRKLGINRSNKLPQIRDNRSNKIPPKKVTVPAKVITTRNKLASKQSTKTATSKPKKSRAKRITKGGTPLLAESELAESLTEALEEGLHPNSVSPHRSENENLIDAPTTGSLVFSGAGPSQYRSPIQHYASTSDSPNSVDLNVVRSPLPLAYRRDHQVQGRSLSFSSTLSDIQMADDEVNLAPNNDDN